MGKARTGLLALVLALILAAPAAGQGGSFADIQTLYDRATAAAAASRHDEAAAHFYEGLEALRAAGAGETPDAGMFAAGLADALAAKGDAQADEAYRLAATLLQNADDPVPFLSVARRFIDRLLAGGGGGEAVALAETALSLTFGPDIPPLLKAEAIEMALGAYGAAGRDAEADKVLARAGSLAGDDPFVAYLRGLARAQVARDAQKDGRMAEAVAALDGAIEDFRGAGERGESFLGVFLLLRGQMAFADGEYRLALPALEEALPILENDPDEEESWTTAFALRGRLLERMDRIADALKAVDMEIAAFEKRMGAGSQMAMAARLDRIEFLVRAGRSAEARSDLEREGERLGGEADPLVAGFFFERLAAIEEADGNFAEAADAAEQSLAIRREHFPDMKALQLEAMRFRADVTGGIADLDYAERAHRELIALSEEIFPPKHPELARDLNAFAAYLASFRRYDEAEAIERRVADILKTAYGEESAKYGFTLHNLANFIVFNGKTDEAIGLFRQSIAIIDSLPDQEDFRALARLNLASALVTARHYEEALTVSGESIALHAGLPNLAQRRLGALYGIRRQALAGLGRDPEAVAAGRARIAAAQGDTY
jgi:tetratricopeptide (TPR) repeat protein